MTDPTRLIDKAKAQFIVDVDGYVYYFPNPHGGSLSAWMLRALADEIDRLNAPWDEIVSKEIGK